MGSGCSSFVTSPITAWCLDRNVTRPWHAPVLSLLCHSENVATFCNDIDLRIWNAHSPSVYTIMVLHAPGKSLQSWTESSTPHFLCNSHGLTRSWRGRRAVDKWSSSSSTFSAWNFFHYKAFDSWTHGLLLVCVFCLFLRNLLGPFRLHKYCVRLNFLGKDPPLLGFSIYISSLWARTHLLISFIPIPIVLLAHFFPIGWSNFATW